MKLAAAVVVVLGAWVARPAVAGPHPRLFLDASTVEAFERLADEGGSAVERAVRHCARVGADRKAEARNVYMALGWAAHASNCAIAYRATGKEVYARTSLHFFEALLDDWDTVGDGRGGDDAATHDSGYAIRAVGVHAAIVYDWLHDAPGMSPALRARARTRFEAWTSWYPEAGYRARHPGTNYHAGYLLAATLIAIAQRGEAGPEGERLWQHVNSELWGRDMKRAVEPGGLLEGGDWPEGWQYGPLAVASYALAARAMKQAGALGSDVAANWSRWAEAVVLRHVHALMPGETGSFAGGDTEADTPSLAPSPWTLAGVAAYPGAGHAAAWALAELRRLGLRTDEGTFLLFEALAEARGITAAPFPHARMLTSYLARGTGTFFARSSWSPGASWMAVQCTRALDVDHQPPNAGNLVITRGDDELIVDPSPYGSLSSLTSNAPTVESAQLPAEYRPSQGYWGTTTGYAWARQTASSITVVRCEYAGQYRFQERPSDVPGATRDIVMMPGTRGAATFVVLDRARTGASSRALHVQFRTPGELALSGPATRATVGDSSLVIDPVYLGAGETQVVATAPGNCFGEDTTRGSCRATRFAVTDHRVKLPGPDALAIHVIDVAGTDARVAKPTVTAGEDHRVISFERVGRRGSVILASGGAGRLSYTAAPGYHVVLEAPRDETGRATVTAQPAAEGCSVVVAAGSSSRGGMSAHPLVYSVSDACAVTEDPTMTAPASPQKDDASLSAPDGPTRPGSRPCGCGGQSRDPRAGLLILLVACLAPCRRL